MINNTTLVGRLTKDPDLRFTGSGVSVANFTLAINRPYKNSNGEREADFINCVIWRGAAENLSNLCQKGMMVGITGSIQTRNYEDNDGKTIFVTEVVADNFQLLEKRDQNKQQSAGSDHWTPNQGLDATHESKSQSEQQRQQGGNFTAQDVQQGKQNDDPFNSSDGAIHITNEDLPF